MKAKFYFAKVNLKMHFKIDRKIAFKTVFSCARVYVVYARVNCALFARVRDDSSRVTRCRREYRT